MRPKKPKIFKKFFLLFSVFDFSLILGVLIPVFVMPSSQKNRCRLSVRQRFFLSPVFAGGLLRQQLFEVPGHNGQSAGRRAHFGFFVFKFRITFAILGESVQFPGNTAANSDFVAKCRAKFTVVNNCLAVSC
ncbi:MAG: hypothetical protein LBR31_01205 [Desulfovibrio sp.]|nr:hypothetical protein [Desulfovibrio sp.]